MWFIMAMFTSSSWQDTFPRPNAMEFWQLLISGTTSVEIYQQFDGISVKLRHQKTCREAYNGL